MKGLKKVRAEVSLATRADNLKRALAVLGLAKRVAAACRPERPGQSSRPDQAASLPWFSTQALSRNDVVESQVFHAKTRRRKDAKGKPKGRETFTKQ